MCKSMKTDYMRNYFRFTICMKVLTNFNTASSLPFISFSANFSMCEFLFLVVANFLHKDMQNEYSLERSLPQLFEILFYASGILRCGK